MQTKPLNAVDYKQPQQPLEAIEGTALFSRLRSMIPRLQINCCGFVELLSLQKLFGVLNHHYALYAEVKA